MVVHMESFKRLDGEIVFYQIHRSVCGATTFHYTSENDTQCDKWFHTYYDETVTGEDGAHSTLDRENVGWHDITERCSY